MVMKFSFCGAFSAASLWLAVLAHTAYAAPPSPVCANPSETCDPEDFSSYSTPSYLGTSFTSPGGFNFELVSGGGQFQVQSLANLGSALFIPGYISEMVLPVDREVVTFASTGGGYFEFYAYNSSGHVESRTVSVFGETNVVRLGPSANGSISRIYIFHLEDLNSCDPDYGEPLITDLKACDI